MKIPADAAGIFICFFGGRETANFIYRGMMFEMLVCLVVCSFGCCTEKQECIIPVILLMDDAFRRHLLHHFFYIFYTESRAGRMVSKFIYTIAYVEYHFVIFIEEADDDRTSAVCIFQDI